MAGSNFDFNKKFDAQIDKFIADTEDKMLAVVKDSIEDLVRDASTPVSEGGHMRVDTGFLRHSGAGAINELPVGESVGDERQPGQIGILPQYANYNPTGSVQGLLPKLKIGDTFYFGWTAYYAIYRELYDGFLDSACQKWKSFVEANARRLKK